MTAALWYCSLWVRQLPLRFNFRFGLGEEQQGATDQEIVTEGTGCQEVRSHWYNRLERVLLLYREDGWGKEVWRWKVLGFSLVSSGTDVVEGHGGQQPLSYLAGRTNLEEGLPWGHKEKDYFEVGSGSGVGKRLGIGTGSGLRLGQVGEGWLVVREETSKIRGLSLVKKGGTKVPGPEELAE